MNLHYDLRCLELLGSQENTEPSQLGLLQLPMITPENFLGNHLEKQKGHFQHHFIYRKTMENQHHFL